MLTFSALQFSWDIKLFTFPVIENVMMKILKFTLKLYKETLNREIKFPQ
jgi:hypothetical protein